MLTRLGASTAAGWRLERYVTDGDFSRCLVFQHDVNLLILASRNGTFDMTHCYALDGSSGVSNPA